VAWLGETSLTRGTYPTYQTPFGKLGTIICYDLMFVDTARNMATGGAQLIGVPSNDWPELSDKEYTHLVFRAVENRVALVKADTRYDSAIIDPYGRIIASQVTTKPSRATLIANVSLGTADAPQIVLGDWMGWLSLAGLVLFSLPGALTRRLFER
jgi:apolipoprotein N-acyltransferase